MSNLRDQERPTAFSQKRIILCWWVFWSQFRVTFHGRENRSLLAMPNSLNIDTRGRRLPGVIRIRNGEISHSGNTPVMHITKGGVLILERAGFCDTFFSVRTCVNHLQIWAFHAQCSRIQVSFCPEHSDISIKHHNLPNHRVTMLHDVMLDVWTKAVIGHRDISRSNLPSLVPWSGVCQQRKGDVNSRPKKVRGIMTFPFAIAIDSSILAIFLELSSLLPLILPDLFRFPFKIETRRISDPRLYELETRYPNKIFPSILVKRSIDLHIPHTNVFWSITPISWRAAITLQADDQNLRQFGKWPESITLCLTIHFDLVESIRRIQNMLKKAPALGISTFGKYVMVLIDRTDRIVKKANMSALSSCTSRPRRNIPMENDLDSRKQLPPKPVL
jgi:hypothetical protein